MRPRRSLPLTTAVTALLLSGCAAQAGPDPAASTPASAAPVSTCVADPEAVIARTEALPTSAMPAVLAATIDAAAQAGFAAAAAPGAIVAVQSPDGLFLQAYGIADPTTGAAMTTDLYQRVGSITKPFTVTLLAQLAAEGELSLDDPISEYIDGVEGGDGITLRELADMTSGIASYTLDEAWQARFFDEPLTQWTPDELIRVGTSLPAKGFAPGTAFDYSNTNTVLLGRVIEKVTGRSYGDALTNGILKPLGMDHSVFPVDAAFPSPHARGYTLQGGRATPDAPEETTDWNPSWAWSAGGLISSASDLLTFGRAEATGAGLLPAAAQLDRLTSFREFNGAGAGGYGLGWGCQNGWVGHAGELPGYNSSMFYDTAHDVTVITMTNSDIPSGDCEAPTLTDNPTGIVCSSPATRIFTSIAAALGTPFAPQR